MNAKTSTWTDLGNGIQVRQSSLYAMNSTVLSDGAHTIVVDPGILPSEIDDIARFTGERAAKETTLVFTHGDWDHVLGRPWWPRAQTIAHDRAAADMHDSLETIRSEAERVARAAGETWSRPFEPFRPRVGVSGLHFRKLLPWRLVFRDAFGHSPSMLSMHLPQQRLLIAGDMLSDIEIPMLAQPCDMYRRTLADLRPVVEGGAIETLVPGHGAIARSRDEVLARLERDETYLIELERRVRSEQAKGKSLEAATAAIALSDCMSDPPAAMDDEHRKNVKIAYDEAEGTSKH